ncbi:MAG: hypothetical protein CL607_08035 [Anaerolineaceae bacterium]|nr:hypothetical protein [Anaerolineaceae bacterium]
MDEITSISGAMCVITCRLHTKHLSISYSRDYTRVELRGYIMTLTKAVVTGAGQGMGRSIAMKLAKQGLSVVLIGKTSAKLEKVANEIQAAGGSAQAYHLDVTDDAGVEAFATWLGDEAVDVLVNNAGDWLVEPFETTENAQFDHIMDVNLRAPYVLSRALLQNLRKSDNASIVNIGSIVTVESHGGVTAYTAAKVGLRALGNSLAAELRPERIRVMMLSPGPANTPMRWDASPDIDPKMLVEPETIAEVLWTMVSLPHGISIRDVVVVESLYLVMDD